MKSLWGEEFDVSSKAVQDRQLIEKASKPKKVEVSIEKKIASKAVPLSDKIVSISAEVNRILGAYADNTIVLRSVEELGDYISKSISNGIVSVDTETNNTLDVFGDCKLMGLCLYTPGCKNAYVPVNHVNYITEELLDGQLTVGQIAQQLNRLIDSNTKCVFHNAVFDIEVLNQTCGVRLSPYWDTMVGAQLIDENESKSLKFQYRTHIDPTQEKYDIEHLFKGLPYSVFTPELFALYAATDSYITYRLYEYQKNIFELAENSDIYWLFKNIEIPVLDSVVDMETNGVCVDTEYASKMSKIYHARSDEIQVKIDEELESLRPIIDNWRKTKDANEHPPANNKTGVGKSKSEKLADPVDLGSPTQMAILLYDVLKVPVVNRNSPRGTDSDILEELAEKKNINICKLLIDKRKVDILINTFIDAIPTFVKNDGRVHCRFNSTGTATGRFSSNNPNLQNIPSHDKLIRMIFKPSDGYAIVGSDYSGQEPRSLCAFAEESEMQRMYSEGKDLYATIASKAFHNEYEQNLEFNPITGKLQLDGKERRNKAKVIQLAITYGMSANSLAESLGCPKEEAETIISDFYKAFPKIKVFAEKSQKMLKEMGYITDKFGRRRHLPDASLPDYEYSTNKSDTRFNPLLHVEGKTISNETRKLAENYIKQIRGTAWKKDRDKIISDAHAKGINIKSNGSLISRALRQCLNARIQGTAASMTKLAMIMIRKDKELNDLGFKLLVTVHDEVFGECPIENSARCGERLCEVMVEAAKYKCSYTPWKCDPYILTDGWYEDEVTASVLNKYKKLIEKGLSEQASIESVQKEYSMLNSESIVKVCKGAYEIGKDSIKYGTLYFEK